MTLVFGLDEAQLVERRKGIGGSDAGKILEGKWYDLWLDKIGQKPMKSPLTPWASALRHTTEGLQLDWYEYTHPGYVVTDRGKVRVCETHPFMRCTLDGLVMVSGDENSGVPINAKHLSQWTKQAREWAIQHYTPQMVHEAIVCGAEYGLLSLLHGEKEPEIIRIDRDPFFEAELIVKERQFWGFVERREPPPDAPAVPIPALATEVKKLREVHLDQLTQGGTDWPNWGTDFTSLARTFAETHAAAVKHNITRDEIKKLVPEDVSLVKFQLVTYKRDGRGQTINLEKTK